MRGDSRGDKVSDCQRPRGYLRISVKKFQESRELQFADNWGSRPRSIGAYLLVETFRGWFKRYCLGLELVRPFGREKRSKPRNRQHLSQEQVTGP
jgi:hypothetical protein